MNESIYTECQSILAQLREAITRIEAIQMQPTNLKELAQELEDEYPRLSYEGTVIKVSVSGLIGMIEEL